MILTKVLYALSWTTSVEVLNSSVCTFYNWLCSVEEKMLHLKIQLECGVL